MKLTNEQLYKAAELMSSEGGHFASSLAKAFYYADLSNRRKLVYAFESLFIEFYTKSQMRIPT